MFPYIPDIPDIPDIPGTKGESARDFHCQVGQMSLNAECIPLHLSVAQSAHIEGLILFPQCHCTEAWGS